MKFFHISDLHIGLKLHNRDLREDQEYVFSQIAEYAADRQPDAVVIAGDIYDKSVPSAEAVETFDRFLMDLRRALPEGEIMMISGNHDSAPRINCYRGILSGQKVHVIGQPPQSPSEHIAQVTMSDEYGQVHFYLLPFVKPSMVKQIAGTDEKDNNLSYDETLRRLLEREEIYTEDRNVLVSHQFYLPSGRKAEEIERMDSEVRTVGNIDEVSAEILHPFDYAALGHIHKPMKVGSERYRYCGTPLAYSVSEAGQEKALLEVELRQKGDVRITALPFQPLRRVRILSGPLEKVLREATDDYVSVVLTDHVDLDVMEMQERLRQAFPNLLEIRRESVRRADYSHQSTADRPMDPLSLVCAFLGNDVNEEEKLLLQDVIQTVQERL